MTVSTFATFRFVESLNYDEVALFVTGDNHLGDALAVVDDKLLLREVDEQHTHLAAIVGMVPGLFKTVMPFFRASPLRGRICASKPAGSAMCKPVGMSRRSKGLSTMGSSRLARRSMPALCSVA